MAVLPEPFPLIDIAGSPAERGLQYGRQAATRIRASLALYAGRLADLGLGPGDIADLVAAIRPALGHFGPHLVTEMEAIAEGAGLKFEDIVLINARTEIIARARRDAGITEDDPDGCTGAVVMPETSANGRLLHAQNWDWIAECVETAIVLRVRPEGGLPFLTFTEAGGLARSGFNAAGIAVTANYLESDLDYRHDGVPLPLIRRTILEQRHMALAMRAVAVTPKACSNNMMLSHKDGFAIDFECAPREVFPLFPENGLMVHANHWVSPVALAKLQERALAGSPDSLYRDWRVRRYLEACGKPGIADVKAALFDDFGSPYAVCRPPRSGSKHGLSATVAMIVMEPAAGVMEVAPLPAVNRTFTRYVLDA
jgi:isopenicillin-N N-acyltransferase-like protein